MKGTSREIDEKAVAVDSFISSKSFQKAINLLLDIVNFYDEVEDFNLQDEFHKKIIFCYKMLAQQSKSQEDFFEAAETYCSAAFLQKEHEKNELAQQLFNLAIDSFVLAGQKALLQKNYLEASRLYQSAAKYAKSEIQNPDKAKEYYNEALEILKEELIIHENNGDPASFCQVQLELGKIYEHLDEHSNALKHYQKILDYSLQKQLHKYTGECFQQMAACHECLGNDSEMVDCLNKAANYRLQEAEKYSERDLPLEAVQNFIAAANCISRINDSDELLKTVIQNEADCFLTVARSNIEKGNLLQAAYYERNAAYCFNQLGQAETSIDLLLAAAEKLLSINEYYGAANNFQDASVYQEHVGNYLKAANYALQAADIAKRTGDIELTIYNFLRAAQFFQTIGHLEKAQYCYSNLADSYENLAEENLKLNKVHIAAFLFFRAATFYSKYDGQEKAASSFEKAIKYYEKAISVAIEDKESLLATYSACCAALVCLIMKQPARAEIILHDIRSNSSNNYYALSNSVIRAYKAQDSNEYQIIIQKFSKIIQNSPEIKNMLDFTQDYL